MNRLRNLYTWRHRLPAILMALAVVVLTLILPAAWPAPAAAAEAPATYTVRTSLSSGADDGFSGAWGLFSGLTWCENGNPGQRYNAWYRFVNVRIPDGAAIVEAYLETTHGRWSYGTHLKIRADRSATPAVPTSTSSHAGKPRTAAGVDWDSGYSDWEVHRSPNIAPVIQELVNTYSFAGGRSIQVLVDDDGSRSGSEYIGGTIEDGWAPALVIVYRAAATTPTPAGTVSIMVPSGLTEGATGTASVNVSNTGPAATAFAVTGMVSVAGQTLTSFTWQPTVSAAATTTRSFTFNIPSGLSGSGQASATLKANGATLNTDVFTFNVAAATAPPPTPTYAGTVSVTVPSGLTEGSSGTATVTVRNTGSTAATFAVTGAVSVEEEGLLAITWQPTVNAGATATRSFTFSIPAGVYGIGEATANMAVNGTILDEDQVTFTVAAAAAPPPAPAAGMTRLNMKSYGNHSAAYDARIIAMRPEFCIDNPAHGLYGEMYGYNDPTLLQNIKAYQAAGIKVIGYITCGYEGGVGEDTGGDGYNSYWYSLDLQKKMIRNMATIDHVDGVFIDECSSYPGAASKAYLLELTSLAHSYGLIVWGNVGVDSFDEWFFTQGGFDFMQSSESWRGQALSSVQQKWGSRIAVTGYNSSYTAQQAYNLTVDAWSKGIRYCYINTVEYTSIASWFEAYVNMLRAAQSSY